MKNSRDLPANQSAPDPHPLPDRSPRRPRTPARRTSAQWPDHVVTFLRIGTALDGSHRRKQAAPKRRPAGCIQENAYCFIFSQNVSGLTNRTTCPGCGETVTLPHVFAEAYPWSRTSFVLKFFSSSHE